MNVNLESGDWRQVEERLRAFLGRRVPAGAVDDLYGDILLRLVAHRSDFESADRPLAWLYRVTANRIADYYRQRAREPAATVELHEDEAPAPAAGGESAAAELAECVLPLIRRLPPPYGEALILAEIQGMKQAEAARRLGLTVSGMKSRVQRGRGMLKQAMLDCCRVSVDRRGGIVDYEKRQGCC